MLRIVCVLACILCAGPGYSYTVGPNYHATSADFLNSAFIKRYHDPAVRATVIAQLGTMAQTGASVVKTTLWQVGAGSESWRLSFPLSTQELSNVERYAQDVAATGLSLQLTLAWLGCADYTIGTPATTVGSCGHSWAAFLDRAQQSIAGLVARIDRRTVARLFLELEVMIGAKPNQDRFLLDVYPYFLSQTAAAGLVGSIYFQVIGEERHILDNAYRDARYPILNGHKSLFWLYRSMDFLRRVGLPLPDRLDFSFYPVPVTATYVQLAQRVADDVGVVFPGYRTAVAETYYFLDRDRRWALGHALRAVFSQVIFWTTPLTDTASAGPPFDFSAYLPALVASPNPCTLLTGQTHCTTMIAWQSVSGARVFVQQNAGPLHLFACGRDGQQAAPWIGRASYRFTMYASATCSAALPTNAPLASLSVTAI